MFTMREIENLAPSHAAWLAQALEAERAMSRRNFMDREQMTFRRDVEALRACALRRTSSNPQQFRMRRLNEWSNRCAARWSWGAGPPSVGYRRTLREIARILDIGVEERAERERAERERAEREELRIRIRQRLFLARVDQLRAAVRALGGEP